MLCKLYYSYTYDLLHQCVFDIYNSRSHVNLEQDEVRRQDVLNSFQAKIQSDIDVLRNLTYRALEQQSQSRLSSFIFLLLFILVVVQVNQILSTF